MSLFGLRPEEPAAIRIREAATRGTLSHALLLTGSGDRMSAACFAAAALECTGGESRPCGVCPACRKVLAGIHPDVITVRDPDHKNIAVDVVRAIRADAYIRPNEGRRKVYVFPDCALLTEQDQNVLRTLITSVKGCPPIPPRWRPAHGRFPRCTCTPRDTSVTALLCA